MIVKPWSKHGILGHWKYHIAIKSHDTRRRWVIDEFSWRQSRPYVPAIIIIGSSSSNNIIIIIVNLSQLKTWSTDLNSNLPRSVHVSQLVFNRFNERLPHGHFFVVVGWLQYQRALGIQLHNTYTYKTHITHSRLDASKSYCVLQAPHQSPDGANDRQC